MHVPVNGASHTLWVEDQADLAQAVQRELSWMASLYIADGHHRMVAAERHPSRVLNQDGAAFTLAAVFPSDEMRILSYHRCFRSPEGTTAVEVLEKLAEQAVTARIEKCGPESPLAPGVIGVHLQGQHYRIWLHSPPTQGDLRTSLDVVALDELLLPPVFGREPARVAANSPAPREGTTTHTCWCAREKALCFLPHPPSIDQVMAMSDAGLVMPPKSTWFDPKAMNGLLIRERF